MVREIDVERTVRVPSSSSFTRMEHGITRTPPRKATTKKMPQPKHQKTPFDVETPLSPHTKHKDHHDVHVDGDKHEKQEKRHFLQTIDGIVYMSYFCNVLALNLPIILLPLAASESAMAVEGSPSVAATVARVSSIATLGGATGKFVSGFVCQRWGPYRCSKLYLIGVALCSGFFSLSTTPTTLGWACAGMEFCASIQWTSLAIMLSQYYARSSPAQLAAGLTAMGIASPAGAIAAKTLGAALASFLDWRIVARLGCLVALLGSYCISKAPIQPFQKDNMDLLHRKYAARPLGSWIFAAKGAAKALLTSKLFWMLSLAHSMAFVVRGIDRILGTFFSDMTDLPRTLTGGLTLSTTLGLLYGLVSASRTFPNLSIDGQMKMLLTRYMFNVGGALGLTGIAAVAKDGMSAPTSPIATKVALSGALALFSGFMSANVSYQFFQFPTMIAKSFGDHKEVCISWLDGIGFLFAAPVFALTGTIVPSYGWVPAWGMLSALLAGAGILMMYALPSVLAKEKETTTATPYRDGYKHKKVKS